MITYGFFTCFNISQTVKGVVLLICYFYLLLMLDLFFKYIYLDGFSTIHIICTLSDSRLAKVTNVRTSYISLLITTICHTFINCRLKLFSSDLWLHTTNVNFIEVYIMCVLQYFDSWYSEFRIGSLARLNN